MQLTKNFHLDEFHCNNGEKVPAEYLDNVKQLANQLQNLRDVLGVPITITSAYRTPHYNTIIGGAESSKHLTAEAVDIQVKGMKSVEVWFVIQDLINWEQMIEGGLGIYNDWVHYDIRGVKARWDKRTK